MEYVLCVLTVGYFNFFLKTLLVKQHTCLFRGHGLGMMTVTLLHCPFYKLPDSLSYIYTIGKIHRVLTQKTHTPFSHSQQTLSTMYLQCRASHRLAHLNLSPLPFFHSLSPQEKNRCVGSTKAAADCVCDVYRSHSYGRFTVNISFIAHTGFCIYTGAPVPLPYTFGHPQSTGGL